MQYIYTDVSVLVQEIGQSSIVLETNRRIIVRCDTKGIARYLRECLLELTSDLEIKQGLKSNYYYLQIGV